MNCAKCAGKELEPTIVPVERRDRPGADKEYGELELDWCPVCGGVWFDNDELERYLDARTVSLPPLAKDVSPAADALPAQCPRCAIALVKHPAPGNPALTVDSCPDCGGLWLDAGELERAAGAGLPLADRLKAIFGGPQKP